MVHAEGKSGEMKSMQADQTAAHPDLTPSLKPTDLSDPGFSKTYRLLSPKDFQQAFSDAEKFANRHWTLIVSQNDKGYPRLGLAISKKQLPRAVWRNRIKRIAREAFRLHKTDLNGYDIVVLGRKGVQETDNQTLYNSFLHLIGKIRKQGLKDQQHQKQKDSNP